MSGEEVRSRGLGSTDDAKAVEMRDGVTRRTLVFGERLLMTHWNLRAGVQFGEHSHPFEQAGFIIKGRLRMIIDGKPTDLTPGSAYLVPMDVKHDAIALENVQVVDIFSPVREEYID